MSLGFQQFGPAIKRLREQGVLQPLYSNYWLSYPQVIEAAGLENVEGSVLITEKSDYPRFLAGYAKIAPDTFRSGVVYRCYAALSTSLSLLGANPALHSREEYAELVKKVQSVNLPDGKLDLPGREARFEPELYVIQKGKAQLLGSSKEER